MHKLIEWLKRSRVFIHAPNMTVNVLVIDSERTPHITTTPLARLLRLAHGNRESQQDTKPPLSLMPAAPRRPPLQVIDMGMPRKPRPSDALLDPGKQGWWGG